MSEGRSRNDARLSGPLGCRFSLAPTARFTSGMAGRYFSHRRDTMLAPQHPQRTLLHNEIHARPPEAFAPPLAITHVAMLADEAQRAASRAHLGALLADHHLPLPPGEAGYLRTDFGTFNLRWEMHTEFVAWTFMRPLAGAELSAMTQGAPTHAIDVVPQAWLRDLPGENLVSLHLWVLDKAALDAAQLVPRLLHAILLVAGVTLPARVRQFGLNQSSRGRQTARLED